MTTLVRVPVLRRWVAHSATSATRGPRPAAALLLAGALLLGGCDGGAEEPPDPGPVTTDPGPVTTAPGPVTTAPDPPTGSPTSEPSEPDPPTGESSEEAPGQPFDLGPVAGAELAVVGFEVDDVLNVRTGPGVEFDIVGGLEPLAADVVATGRSRQLDAGSVWVEVTAGGIAGWANLRYLAYLGQTDDVTARLDQRPSGDDLVEVAELVARQRVPAEDAIEVTVVDGPRLGDLAEVTVDVLGLLDDSVLGERLHVFALVDGGTYTVRTVEATVLCARGVQDGLCL